MRATTLQNNMAVTISHTAGSPSANYLSIRDSRRTGCNALNSSQARISQARVWQPSQTASFNRLQDSRATHCATESRVHSYFSQSLPWYCASSH